ncbi:MAG: GerMN domain-containing protein [Elainellaceae cyanobacterium]
MQDQQPMETPRSSRRIPLSIIAAVSAVVLAAGSGTAWWMISSNNETPAPPDTTSQVEPTTPDATTNPPSTNEPSQVPAAAATTAQVYLIEVAGDRFELVPSEVQIETEDAPEQVLASAFERLLSNDVESDAFSAIPTSTELLSLTIEDNGVHVNFSSDFQFGGGSASMTGRLAQVIYTASTLEPTAPVWISLDGEPLELLGGEGLIVDQPMTRAQFEENFSL